MSTLVIHAKLRAGALTLDIELEASAGITMLTGASASGKTLLLRAIAGLSPLEEGRITLGGDDLASRQTHERGIGYAPQDPSLWPHLRAIEHLTPFADRGRIAELASKLELDPILSRHPSALSGGERQRLSLARALARKSKLMLLDEPTSALDRATKERIGDVIKEETRGAIVIFVTHDLPEAKRLGDMFACVEAGRVSSAPRPD